MNPELRKILINEFRKEAASNFYMPDYYAEALNEVADMLETPRYTSEQITAACIKLGINISHASDLLDCLWNLDKKEESE